MEKTDNFLKIKMENKMKNLYKKLIKNNFHANVKVGKTKRKKRWRKT